METFWDKLRHTSQGPKVLPRLFLKGRTLKSNGIYTRNRLKQDQTERVTGSQQ